MNKYKSNKFHKVKLSAVALFSLLGAMQSVSAETLINNVYSQKGLAGTLEQTKLSDHKYTGKIEFGWNNRRILVNETLELNDQGLPVSFTANGQSAFGAPINETFTWINGKATWQNDDESGSVQDQPLATYVPKNTAITPGNALMRYLIKSGKKQANVLPQGSVNLTKLNTLTLNGQTVALYAMSGLGLSPSFGWYDKNGDFFAANWGSMFMLRDGFKKEQFEQLKEIQLQAEQTYLENMSAKLTHHHPELIINNVNVFDVEAGKTITNQNVHIKNGKIAAIGKTVTAKGQIAKGQIAKVDGTGKTLIPGLWDMHGHLSKETGILNIANGVLSVRDMGNEHDNIMEIESLFDTNTVLGTRVYRAGFMDQYSENSAGLSVKTLEEALETVDFFADNGYVQVKLYSSIDPKWVAPIAKRAQSRGLRLSGHVPAFMTAEQAINNGYNEIQHINMLFLNFLAGTEVDTRTTQRFSLIGEEAADMPLDSKEVNDFIKLLADNQIVVDPTVSTFRSLLMRENKKVDQEFVEISSHLPPNFVRGLKGAEMHIEDIHKINYQRAGEAMQQMLKKLYDAGVYMVPGTDNVAGFTLLRELELYTMAGIPESEVLKMATIKSANLMNVGHLTGSVAVGKVADLVLVDGDPVKDIKALRKLALIVKGEQVFKPSEIYNEIGIKPFTESSKVHF